MAIDAPMTQLELIEWNWSRIEPCFKELASTRLSAANLPGWMQNWSRLHNLLDEVHWRLYVARTVDTTNAQAASDYTAFMDNVYPRVLNASQKLKLKLLVSGLALPGLEVPLRNIRCEAELYRESNLALISKLYRLAAEYDKIIGAQSVHWEGEEVALTQLFPAFQALDRGKRERAWRLAAQRQLAERETINRLWVRYMGIRERVAANADLPNYRAYRWQRLLRFDYTPRDCYRFHKAIEEVVVPAATRLYAKRRKQLGIPTVRPWDVDVDPLGRPPLRPFETTQELEGITGVIFERIDPHLGRYFQTMRREGLLDLESRKGKAPGGYCTEFRVNQVPFIFMNATNTHDDVQSLLHEGGHAFHVFETRHLPYHLQYIIPLEFMEVASIAMEYLGSAYLRADEGGFYSPRDAARARIRVLEQTILFWPYMAVVDAFQHWAYENHQQASNPANCDATWSRLWKRFMPGEDWRGLEQEACTGWQRKMHIHQDPFYFVEYGLAQLAGIQILRAARQDHGKAIRAYRQALSLGGTRTLPQLYAAAGARLAFDARTLKEAVDFIENTIQQLEAI
ncbi:MAG: M3 family oligoendopeptidase [Anaerolineales bacterium]|nr:M3 family oligoendopeptidase [Anaerolineales bacterium]